MFISCTGFWNLLNWTPLARINPPFPQLCSWSHSSCLIVLVMRYWSTARCLWRTERGLKQRMKEISSPPRLYTLYSISVVHATWVTNDSNDSIEVQSVRHVLIILIDNPLGAFLTFISTMTPHTKITNVTSTELSCIKAECVSFGDL